MKKMIISLLGLTLLSGCSQTHFPKTHPLPHSIFKKAVDWSKLESMPRPAVNNYQTTWQDKGQDFMLPQLMAQYHVSEPQAHRLFTITHNYEIDDLLTGIKEQLGDNFVTSYWDFGDLETRQNQATDKEAIENVKLIIIARTNVKAVTHHYIFNTLRVRGYSVPIEIRPSAKYSQAETVTMLNNQEVMEKITRLVESYGGESMGTGLRVKNKVRIYIYFPKGKPNKANLDKLNTEISRLTDLETEIQVQISPMIL